MRPAPHRPASIGLLAAVLVAAVGAESVLPAPPAAALFDSDEMLELTLEGDLKTLFGDRDSVKAQWHPATLSYLDTGGSTRSLDIEAKTRGHWRRKTSHCDVPPLRLDFPKDQPEGSLFAGQDKLKLTTPCRGKSVEYEQYVLREFLVYKIYNLLTPKSFRTRLARITYIDRSGRLDTLRRKYSFFVEDQDRMAERNGAVPLDVQGARFADLDFGQIGLVALFEYSIGGTDWSVAGLHNVRLIKSSDGETIFPVPYDFDWTGIVATRYAVPDYRLPIKSVRERLYRGPCRTLEQWAPILERFAEQKDSIYALYPSLLDLDPKYAEQTRKYLDDFYRVIGDPRAVRRELVDPCREAA